MAFLLQMNDYNQRSDQVFDRFLERRLHEMLDQVVAAIPPARGERLDYPAEPTLAIGPAAEPLPLPLPVASAPQL